MPQAGVRILSRLKLAGLGLGQRPFVKERRGNIMKRGMHALFGTIAIALFAASSYANAPTWRTIPDVIIGDDEDNVGFTIDQNYFRYVNALNFQGLITDVDSPTTSLKFAYLEASTHDDISIQDKRQLNLGLGELPNSPGTWNASVSLRTVPSGSFFMSFRDTFRSPLPHAVPYPDPLVDPANVGAGSYGPTQTAILAGRNANGTWNLLGGRPVVLYAADGNDNVASRTLLVYSINHGVDALSGAYSTVFSDTLQTTSNWKYTTVAGMSIATSAFAQNLMSLSAGATATGALNKFFGRWETRDSGNGFNMKIPYVTGNKIYVARFFLTPSGPSNKGNLPTIRLGSYISGSNLQIVNWIGSVNNTDPNANPQLPALNTQRIYPVYWSSHDWTPNFNNLFIPLSGIDARTFALFFDVHDVNQQTGLPDDNGLWSLTNVEVLTIDRPATKALESNLTNLTAGGSWGLSIDPVNSAGGVTINQNTATGTITFAVPAGASTSVAPAQFLLWGYARAANVGLYNWDGKLRRASLYMACPTTADRNNFHRVRLRHMTFGEFWFQEFYVRQQFLAQGNPIVPVSQQASPGQFTRYESYVAPYGQATALITSVGWHKISPVIDQLYNIPGQTNNLATNTIVQKMTFESFDEPTF